jgi:hypothetical protein
MVRQRGLAVPLTAELRTTCKENGHARHPPHPFRHPPPGCRHIVLPLRHGLRLKSLTSHLLNRYVALKALSNFGSRLAADMSNLVVFRPSRTWPQSQSPGGTMSSTMLPRRGPNCGGGRLVLAPSEGPTPRSPVDRARITAVAAKALD